MIYDEYLQTKHWKRFRKKALRWARHHCQLCSSKHYLNVHHNSYERVGKERRSDVIVLCRDCHKRHHGILPVAVGGIPPIGDLDNLKKLLRVS